MLGKAVSDEMPKELKILTPIPGTAYLRKTSEARIDEKVWQLFPGASMSRKRIKLTLQDQKAATNRRMLPTQSNGAQSAGKLPPRRAAKKTNDEVTLPRLPPPGNKKQYRAEACVLYCRPFWSQK
jgi:hypothetical protein